MKVGGSQEKCFTCCSPAIQVYPFGRMALRRPCRNPDIYELRLNPCTITGYTSTLRGIVQREQTVYLESYYTSIRSILSLHNRHAPPMPRVHAATCTKYSFQALDIRDSEVRTITVFDNGLVWHQHIT